MRLIGPMKTQRRRRDSVYINTRVCRAQCDK